MSLSSDVRPIDFAQLSWPMANGTFAAEAGAEARIELPDVETIKDQAFEEGFQRGYDEGVRIAAEQQQTKVEALARLAENAVVDAARLIRALEEQAVELSLAVAEKVVVREAQIDRELVLRVIREALDELEDVIAVHIRVHPDDYELAQRFWDETLAKGSAGAAKGADLVADELVEMGGCVVETRVGRVDAQPKVKLAQIATTFHALLDGETA